MITTLGMGMIMIWLLNLGFIIYELYKHTPNWQEEDAETIVHNFMANTPLERMQMIQFIARNQPMFGMGGLVLLISGLLIGI